MILFNSKEKDRNYHRSKKKFFNHNNIKSSKQKQIPSQQEQNNSNNFPIRSRSPSKKSKGARSPSRQSKNSKKSNFSQKDKLMTKQIISHTAQYVGNMTNEKKKEFKTKNEDTRQNQKIKQRRSVDIKLIRRRSKQHQKDQPIRRKQKFTNLFQKIVSSTHIPQRTPPKSPKHNFLQQKGEIQPGLENSGQDLQQLRQENQFYKIIYRASLQKMKRLQNHIHQQKENYQKTRETFQKQLKDLKYKILRADKKVNIGHIFSYDQKSMLKVEADKIITQTDNEASQITNKNEKSKQKDQLPSRLSIQST